MAEISEHAGLFVSGRTPGLSQSLLDAADTQSPYKRRELTRIGDLIALLSIGPRALDAPMRVSSSLCDVLSSVHTGQPDAPTPGYGPLPEPSSRSLVTTLLAWKVLGRDPEAPDRLLDLVNPHLTPVFKAYSETLTRDVLKAGQVSRMSLPDKLVSTLLRN